MDRRLFLGNANGSYNAAQQLWFNWPGGAGFVGLLEESISGGGYIQLVASVESIQGNNYISHRALRIEEADLDNTGERLFRFELPPCLCTIDMGSDTDPGTASAQVHIFPAN